MKNIEYYLNHIENTLDVSINDNKFLNCLETGKLKIFESELDFIKSLKFDKSKMLDFLLNNHNNEESILELSISFLENDGILYSNNIYRYSLDNLFYFYILDIKYLI